MAHGQPDYGMYAQKSTIYGLSDMAELAVRLGSINSFDRRGEVVFLDSFEGGLTKWAPVTSISAVTVVQSQGAARSGGFAAKFTGSMVPETVGGIEHYEHYPVLSKLGAEASFTLEADLTYVEIESDLYNGSTYQRFRIRYHMGDQKLQYADSAGAWVDLATGVSIYGYLPLFHTLKVVGDAATGKYVRCLLDDQEYDLSGIACQAAASADVKHWRATVLADWLTVASASIYVDDVILTQNEPE